jgi:hypothetical protein
LRQNQLGLILKMAKQQQSKQRQQLPGEGLSDQQQEALMMLGKMMGPETDAFDEEVQRLRGEEHKAEHDATDYEAEFAELPHEAG